MIIRKRYLGLVALAVGGLIFWLTLRQIGFSASWAILGRITICEYIVIGATLLGQFLLITLAVKIILARLGDRLSVAKLLPLQLIKFSIGYITPFLNVGGEPVQVYFLKKKYNVSYAHSTAAILMEGFLRLTFASFFIVIGFIYLFLNSPFSSLGLALGFMGIMGSFLFLFFYSTYSGKGFVQGLFQVFRLNKLKFYKKIAQSVKNLDYKTHILLRRSPRSFALVAALTFINIVLILFRYYLLLYFLGLVPTLTDTILVFTLIQILIIVPIPTGLGVHEAGQTGIFILRHISTVIGIGFTLALRIINLVVTIPGFIFLARYGLKLRDAINGRALLDDFSRDHISSSKSFAKDLDKKMFTDDF